MLKKILSLLNSAEQKHAFILTLMVIVMAFLEMLGVASIFPFVTVLSNPDLVQTNPYLKSAFDLTRQLGFETRGQFLFALGLMVLILTVSSLIFKALTTYAQVRFTSEREYGLSKRLVEGYLNQPYTWFLNRHSADLGKTILSEVNAVIVGALTPVMTLVTQSTILLAMLIMLIVVDPLIALIVGLVLGLTYVGVFFTLNDRIKRLGEKRVKANKERFASVSEAFGAVKEIKVGCLERVYIEGFARPAKMYADSNATLRVIKLLPRYFIEAIAFGAMILSILYLMQDSGSFVAALPIISIYAMAAYRILPALQQIYAAFTQLRYVGPALDLLHNDLSNIDSGNIPENEPEPLHISKGIKLNQVSYIYPDSPHFAIECIDLHIPVNNTIGLVGETGSGKTTIVDVVLGLLNPQEGYLSIDDKKLNYLSLRQWQRNIGYVPQQINLIDDTILANIALGVHLNDVDHSALERAAKIAKLHQFVIELPRGYSTIVGERGVRLSGGQRQRIGIARALYHNPKVLILDEATSALDNLTEQSLMDTLDNLGHDITIILIAHRLSTVLHCDRIFLIEKGKVKAEGTFDELSKLSNDFRAMLDSVRTN